MRLFKESDVRKEIEDWKNDGFNLRLLSAMLSGYQPREGEASQQDLIQAALEASYDRCLKQYAGRYIKASFRNI